MGSVVRQLWRRILVTNTGMPIFLCPADRRYACSWEGPAEDILHHFELEHDELLHFSDTFTVDTNVPSENLLLLIDEEIYLAQLKRLKTSMEIRLRYLGPTLLAKKISYNVLLRVDNELASANAIRVEEGRIEVNLDELNGDKACIRCTLNITKPENILGNETDVVSLEPQDFLDDFMPRKLSLDEIMREEEESKIELRKKSSDVHLSRSNTINFLDSRRKMVSRCKSTLSLGAINESVPAMNCMSCNESLMPPINYCPCGQTLCGTCHTSTCQICKSRDSDGRNHELENKRTVSLMPCRYRKIGCPVKVLDIDLQDHEIHCVFCEYRCPMDECSFEGQFRYMLKHLKLIHGSTKQLECFFISFQTYPEAFLALEEKGIFYCRTVFSDGFFLFEAKFCGPKEREFFCELQFREGKLKQPMLLQRTDNVYSIKLSQQELKKMKLKAKHAILTITA